jgi:hypothetical protein
MLGGRTGNNFLSGPISCLTALVHLVDVFTELHTFLSLDMVLCPELGIYMKELVVLRPVI